MSLINRIRLFSMERSMTRYFDKYVRSEIATTRAAGDNSDENDNIDENINAATTNVTPVGEASMTGGGYIKDSDPGVMNFDAFGFVIDTNAVSQSTDPAASAEVLSTLEMGNNPYLGHLEQQQKAGVANIPTPAPAPVPLLAAAGGGRHKVDNPTPAKPATKKKAEADNVNVALDAISVETTPRPPKELPEGIVSALPQAQPIEEEPAKPLYDNTAITSKYTYMGKIEKLALEHGAQIQMTKKLTPNGEDSGLINCFVYTPESYKPNIAKCFTIDTGSIIDHRAKLFPIIIESGYECYPCYPVLVPKDTDDGRKGKNVLNEKMFNDIFVGGVQMLPNRFMYTPELVRLNQYVALITMPTNNMNKETRTIVRDRLLRAVNEGVFEEALKHDPYSRFRFVPGKYNKKTLEFTLSNKGVPYRFGGTCKSTKEIEIAFGDGNTVVNVM